MASLGELVDYAKTIQQQGLEGSPGGRIAKLMAAGIGGYQSGQQQAETDAKNRLDSMVKMLDIRDKLAKIDETNQRVQIEGNFAKSLGLLPLTPQETGTARTAAFDNIGSEKAAATADNTTQGKIATLFNMKNLTDAYDAVPGFSSKGGLSVSFKKKNSGGAAALNAQAVFRQKVSTLATKMATMESADALRAKYGEQATAMFPNIKPSQDQYQKYLPVAESYLAGDQKAYESLVQKRRAALFPLGVLPGMADGASDPNALDLGQSDGEDANQ